MSAAATIDAGPASALPPGESRIVSDGRRSIGVFNVGGSYHALLNRCPHAGAPLCLGATTGMSRADSPCAEVEWVRQGEILRCPWHGWEFEIATGETVTEPILRARRFPVSVEDGRVLVHVGKGGDR